MSFGLRPEDRARHLYLLGQTGTGKSTLLCNLIRQDIEAGNGVTLIDPHGDLADTVIDLIPTHRIDDVVILDPTDHAHVPAINPFYRVPLDDRPRVASGLVSTFKHVWADSWGPRLEYLMSNSARLVLDAPDHLRPSMVSVARLLVEGDYRQQLLEHCTDARVRSYFVDRFNRWSARQLEEALSPVENKLGSVLANPFVRNILCQWRPTIQMADIIAQKKILIARLPKGSLGEQDTNLIGSILVSSVAQAAMAPRPERVLHDLYLDEVQSFTTRSFQLILSEARKFGLRLTIGHQFIDQLSDDMQAAIFGNVGNLVAFRVGATDALELSRQVPGVAASRFVELERGQVVARLLDGGEAREPVIGTTTPPVSGVGTAKRVWAKSRRAHTRPRHEVERRLARWLGN
ncbi:MAG: DUF87 domain-containing protein [Pseudomonadota bacterium]